MFNPQFEIFIEMKKYLFGLVALLCGVLSSCTNSEEIEIVKSHELVFEINTQSIYDEFGLTNNIKNQLLRDKNYAVAVKSLIYDENGALVDSMTTYAYDTNSMQQTYKKLPYGQYTGIFIETLVYSDTKLPKHYRIAGAAKLSTLEIKQIDAPYWYAIIGVKDQKFTFGDNAEKIYVTPKTLGHIINCNFYNWTKSSSVNLAIGTEEIYEGYRLDPSIAEENRYSTTLMESDTFYPLGDTKVSDDTERFDIYVLGKSLTYTLYYQTTQNANTTSWNYLKNYRTINNLKTGEISYIGYAFSNDEKGTVYGYHGDYNGMAQWYNNIVLGTGGMVGDLVPELYMTWGGSVTNVQASMKDYTMTQGSSGRAVLQGDGSYAISYRGKGKENKIIYSFTSATTGLFEVDVQYSKSDVSSSDILDYLNNNYIHLADEAGTYMYCTNDAATFVLFFEIDGVWNIGFVDADHNNMSAKTMIPSFKMPKKSTAKKTVVTLDNSFLQNYSSSKNYTKRENKAVVIRN